MVAIIISSVLLERVSTSLGKICPSGPLTVNGEAENGVVSIDAAIDIGSEILWGLSKVTQHTSSQITVG